MKNYLFITIASAMMISSCSSNNNSQTKEETEEKTFQYTGFSGWYEMLNLADTPTTNEICADTESIVGTKLHKLTFGNDSIKWVDLDLDKMEDKSSKVYGKKYLRVKTVYTTPIKDKYGTIVEKSERIFVDNIAYSVQFNYDEQSKYLYRWLTQEGVWIEMPR